MTALAGPSYPASLTVDAPLEVARWRPLVAWLLAIPHFIVLYALQLLGQVLAVISWFTILFTGKVPRGVLELQCMCLRYATRTIAYSGFLLEPYPPFAFGSAAADPGDLPGLRIDFVPAEEGRNRLTTFFRALLVIPQLIVLLFVHLGAFFVWFAAFFAVLVTGAWPEGMRRYVVGALRWNVRVNAYAMLLTDEYPPFSLD